MVDDFAELVVSKYSCNVMENSVTLCAPELACRYAEKLLNNADLLTVIQSTNCVFIVGKILLKIDDDDLFEEVERSILFKVEKIVDKGLKAKWTGHMNKVCSQRKSK